MNRSAQPARFKMLNKIRDGPTFFRHWIAGQPAGSSVDKGFKESNKRTKREKKAISPHIIYSPFPITLRHIGIGSVYPDIGCTFWDIHYTLKIKRLEKGVKAVWIPWRPCRKPFKKRSPKQFPSRETWLNSWESPYYIVLHMAVQHAVRHAVLYSGNRP